MNLPTFLWRFTADARRTRQHNRIPHQCGPGCPLLAPTSPDESEA